jgi:hypothetical protein
MVGQIQEQEMDNLQLFGAYCHYGNHFGSLKLPWQDQKSNNYALVPGEI